MKQSPLIPKILAILEHHGFRWPAGKPPADLCIRRTYAGHQQRNAGAWSWCLWSDTEPKAANVGSQDPASDIARLSPEWTTLYRMPYDITFGAIARYQDGQPFSRMVVVRDLNQGAEAVRAYPSGGTRFTFTGTLDLRLQKGFRIGTTRLDVMLDAYNLLTRSNEVEEDVVTGPAFRTSTAIQPPHSVHLGLRMTF